MLDVGRPVEGGAGQGSSVVAFLSACTHQGCPVDLSGYSEDTNYIECTCHGSRFDPAQRGRMIMGRASQHLVRVLLEVSEQGEIYAVGTEGLCYGAPMDEAHVERV